MNSPVQAIFQLSTTMTDFERSTQLNRINARIDKIFADGEGLGADQRKDFPLCSVLHIMEQLLPSNSTTPTVAMVLTNEDDVSIFSRTGDKYVASNTHCFRELQMKLQVAEFSGYRYYQGKKTTYKAKTTIVRMVDGQPNTISTFVSVPVPYSEAMMNNMGSDCVTDVQTTYKKELDAAVAVRSYGQVISYTVETCTGTVSQEHIMTTSDFTKDYCADDLLKSYGGSAYIPGSCEKWAELPPSLTIVSSSDSNTVTSQFSPGAADGFSAIKMSIAEKFNLNNFYFSFVINPSSGVCQSTQGSSFGLKYEQLAAYEGINSSITPICSGDYSNSVIDNALNFINTVPVNSVSLPEGYGARLVGIEINRSGSIIKTTEGTHYTVSGDVVMFNEGVLKITDKIVLYYK